MADKTTDSSYFIRKRNIAISALEDVIAILKQKDGLSKLKMLKETSNNCLSPKQQMDILMRIISDHYKITYEHMISLTKRTEFSDIFVYMAFHELGISKKTIISNYLKKKTVGFVRTTLAKCNPLKRHSTHPIDVSFFKNFDEINKTYKQLTNTL